MNVTLKLQRKSATDEWVVVWKEDGKRVEEKCYYTDSKDDAVSTMAMMQRSIDGTTTEQQKIERAVVATLKKHRILIAHALVLHTAYACTGKWVNEVHELDSKLSLDITETINTLIVRRVVKLYAPGRCDSFTLV